MTAHEQKKKTTENQREKEHSDFHPASSPYSWSARMQGARVAGQRADSAAGYCLSKTLSESENIVIHLHIFSSHRRKHNGTDTNLYRQVRIHTHTSHI